MRRRALLLIGALFLTSCASDDLGSGADTSASAPGSVVPASVTETAVTQATAVATSVAGTTVTGTAVTGTTVSGPSVPLTSVTATSITDSSTAPTSDSNGDSNGDSDRDERPFDVYVPSSYDGSTPVALVVLLHGFTASGELQEAYFHLQPLAEQHGFLYVHPDGTTDSRGLRFWNTTDGCCNFFGSTVDDSAYLASLIQQVEAQYRVDPRRIYFIGHSNGGFMSYRMACDHADKVAAIVSLAGGTFTDVNECSPTQPVSVLQIHGTADEVIRYEGGRYDRFYPSAPTTVQTWATYDGCGQTVQVADQQRDLDRDIEGSDSSVSRFTDCPAGIDVELWTIEGGGHIPSLSSTFAEQALDFLFAHPKP